MNDGEFTEDAIFAGRVSLRQPRHGYRINLDTVLLAAAMRGAGGRVLELGCGVGAGVIAVATASPEALCIGLERDPGSAALARLNAAANGVAGRVVVVEADGLAPPADLGQFDAIFFNPPYDDPSEGRAPAEARRGAHVEERSIDDWIKLWSNRMNSGARFTLIHRAHRLDDILAALRGRLGGVDVLPIRPRAGAPAHRVLVRATKGSRAPLRLYAGLVLHPEDREAGQYTPETQAIVRGEAGVWPD